MPDFEFPTKDDLDYENYIVGVVYQTDHWGFNVIMSNGQTSSFKNILKPIEVRMNPPDAEVRKVVMCGDEEIAGFQFFDKDGIKILEAGCAGK